MVFSYVDNVEPTFSDPWVQKTPTGSLESIVWSIGQSPYTMDGFSFFDPSISWDPNLNFILNPSNLDSSWLMSLNAGWTPLQTLFRFRRKKKIVVSRLTQPRALTRIAGKLLWEREMFPRGWSLPYNTNSIINLGGLLQVLIQMPQPILLHHRAT